MVAFTMSRRRAGYLNSDVQEFLRDSLSASVAPPGPAGPLDGPVGRSADPLSPSASAGALPGSGDALSTLSFDGHQFHRPSSTTVQGTSTVLTTNVSMMTPIASPAPTSTI